MNLEKCLLIKNACYKTNKKMTGNKPTGIVVHSTGANNKTLKRYVQPVSGQDNYKEILSDIGKNGNGNHWNQDAPSGRSVCVHAFIGVNAAGKVKTYQTLPFEVCCWGVGAGLKGSYNYNPTARVQFEICEDDLTDPVYFNAAMKEAQEFCAYLCGKYGLSVDKICSHCEAHKKGYGSNHGDPDHWLKKFGKDMDWFRAEVKKLIEPPKIAASASAKPAAKFKAGDVVKIAKGATYYNTKTKVPSWVLTKSWVVKSVNGDRVVVDKASDGTSAICSAIDAKYLSKTAVKSTTDIAKEVIAGKWGNDPERTRKLTAAGYDAKAVQKKVNELMK